MANFPEPMTWDELVATLKEIAALVEAGDSWEGFIEYAMPCGEVVPEGTYALVRASYRIGNLDGQGGIRMIGRIKAPPMIHNADLDGPVPDYTKEEEATGDS
jgi:hypothetical protein